MNGNAAKNFAKEWNGRGDEERDYYAFWYALLRDLFGIDKPENFIKPQEPAHFEHTTKHIDIYIPQTKVIIEQKSFGDDLNRKYRQSDGEYLTPFEQAKRYADALPASKRPRRIVVCNFNEFRIYDLQQMDSLEYLSGAKIYSPTVVKLENFRNDWPRLKFIVDPDAEIKPEVKISQDAAKIVQNICLAIDKDYAKRDAAYIDALSKLCARLVFCFYADDDKLFTAIKFEDYLKKFSANELQDALQKLFDVLNTEEKLRPENIGEDLKKFPHVDGGLFDEKIPIPPLNERFKHELDYAHYFRSEVGSFRFDEFGKLLKFSWRGIEPTIFGAMFESVFNEQTRRKGGIHYTTPENIHKMIDQLFLDDLRNEFNLIRRKHKDKIRLLKNFQDKLASLNFLDPACGSGNFLTETYIRLRELENEVIKELCDLYANLPANPVKVTPRQFYGIEINDFAVAVAKDALWISEIQMLRKTSWIIGRDLPELPLRKYISIHKANALQIDWRTVAPNVDYIIGNPPFRGYSEQTPAQKAEMRQIFTGNRKAGKLDYVSGWYKKAAEFIQGTDIRCAFVSTNSVVQGEQCADLWKELYEQFNIHVDFAHRTFKWLSDSENMAHVHCVVVGFSSAPNDKPKKIFDGDKARVVDNINFYLTDGEITFVEARTNHIQDGVPKMQNGNRPADGGALIIEADDYEPFIRNEPAAKKFIKRLIGAEEFINGKKRYCLWLDGVSLDEIKNFPLVAERVEACRQNRLKGAADRRKLAATPHLFRETNNPARCLVVPSVSSERRFYIPIDFLPPSIIASNLVFMIPDAELYHFGILTSSIHMAWMRTVAGRLESRYRYSKDIVYNNFPWPAVGAARRAKIEQTAQEILTVRKKFSSRTFASLYDEATMPEELRDAHKMNDTAVALAYGFEGFLTDEARIVAELMKLYRALTSD